jgi:hypothetical protein
VFASKLNNKWRKKASVFIVGIALNTYQKIYCKYLWVNRWKDNIRNGENNDNFEIYNINLFIINFISI